MQRLHKIDELRAATALWRSSGDTIALVPTMGNLHAGHISLVELAAEQADHVIVSVFVNPTQFGPNEDFAKYPRTLDIDSRRLSRANAAILFAPDIDEMYPHGLEQPTQVVVPELSEILCGASRPGHFVGVTSVVCRLLNICGPNIAVFGQKDYQQYVILERMVRDLHLPVSLIAGETQREDNGLARSSRNNFLDDSQRQRAAVIFAAITAVADALTNGSGEYTALEASAARQIEAQGLEPEYVSIRRAEDLAVPKSGERDLVVLAAARLDKVRLIDNLRVAVTKL